MLDDLYQDLILDHGKRPRNFGPLPGCTHEAEGLNPFCGDQVHVRLILEGDRLQEVRFEGAGCAISTASASMMTQMVKGKTIEEAQALFSRFHDAALGRAEPENLGELEALCGVKDYPNRIKCATLAWHALVKAIEGGGATTTEAEDHA